MWERALAVNATATFMLCQAFGRGMIERGRGKIINVGSTDGIVGVPEQVAYCASKGAVVQITRTLGAEWIKHGVNVNAIGPCDFDTPMIASALAEPDYSDWILQAIPAGGSACPGSWPGPWSTWPPAPPTWWPVTCSWSTAAAASSDQDGLRRYVAEFRRPARRPHGSPLDRLIRYGEHSPPTSSRRPPARSSRRWTAGGSSTSRPGRSAPPSGQPPARRRRDRGGVPVGAAPQRMDALGARAPARRSPGRRRSLRRSSGRCSSHRGRGHRGGGADGQARDRRFRGGVADAQLARSDRGRRPLTLAGGGRRGYGPGPPGTFASGTVRVPLPVRHCDGECDCTCMDVGFDLLEQASVGAPAASSPSRCSRPGK